MSAFLSLPVAKSLIDPRSLSPHYLIDGRGLGMFYLGPGEGKVRVSTDPWGTLPWLRVRSLNAESSFTTIWHCLHQQKGLWKGGALHQLNSIGRHLPILLTRHRHSGIDSCFIGEEII